MCSGLDYKSIQPVLGCFILFYFCKCFILAVEELAFLSDLRASVFLFCQTGWFLGAYKVKFFSTICDFVALPLEGSTCFESLQETDCVNLPVMRLTQSTRMI